MIKITEVELFNKCKSENTRQLEDMELYFQNFPSGDHIVHIQGWYREGLKKFLIDLSSRDKIVRGFEFKQKSDSFRQLQPELSEFWTKVIDDICNITVNAKKEYISELKSKRGKLKAKEYASLFDESILNNGDFAEIGITRDELSFLKNARTQTVGTNVSDLERGTNYSLPEKNTELYFWGMPSSGKTCCIGSILKVAEKKGWCAGYDSGINGASYFEKLTNIFTFDGGLCTLVASTNENSIAFASYRFLHPKLKKRKVCFIDLAGETFKSMRLSSRGEELDEIKELCLDVTTNYLRDKRNRKIHFFLVPYSNSDRVELKDGISMSNYLQAGVEYLNVNKVISQSTDGIYIIVTKSDLLGANSEDMDLEAKKFIIQKYPSFYNGLNQICEDNGIGIGKERVNVLSFSIGSMLADEVCRFNAHGAERLIELICKKSFKEQGWFGRLLDIIFRF